MEYAILIIWFLVMVLSSYKIIQAHQALKKSSRKFEPSE
jgi:hypothetical protein